MAFVVVLPQSVARIERTSGIRGIISRGKRAIWRDSVAHESP